MTAHRYLECAFPRRGVVAVVELLDDGAPATCRALRERLPVEADTFHSKWGGQQLFLVLPSFDGPPPENETRDVALADVLLVRRDATDRAAPRRLRAAGLGDYAELSLCYGASVRAYGPTGRLTVSRIGRIVEGLDHLAKAAAAMRREGFETIQLRDRS